MDRPNRGASSPPPPLLEVRDLTTHIRTSRGVVQAVDGVSFTVEAGETLGLVGESGCGKSMTGLSLMGLLPPYADVEGGVWLDGREILGLPAAELAKLRGAGGSPAQAAVKQSRCRLFIESPATSDDTRCVIT